MQILITNAAEAEMPEEMQENCQTLLLRRINHLFPDSFPKEGESLTILYSEKDPLLQSEEVDDTAYFIYFDVEKVENGENRAGASVWVRICL